MSLLMDALKRAELAKQQGRGDPASGLTMAATDVPEQGAALPGLPKLEDLDDEFIAHANSTAGQPPGNKPGRAAAPSRSGVTAEHEANSSAGTTADRNAIRNAFAAKGGMDRERQGMVIAAGLALLALGGAGAYIWFQLKPTPTPAAARPAAGSAATRPRLATQPDPQIANPPRNAVPPAVSVQRTRQPELPDDFAPARPRRTDTLPARPVRQAPVLPEADSAIRVTSTRAGIDPAISDAYRLLIAGDLERSRATYAKVLRNEPRNADALHGIAAIALREGRTEEAALAYRQIIESNPGDSAAQAGLVGLNAQGDPVAGESRIKSLIATQGELPVLNFALGNLYARQQRWNDAQQAYFKAMTGEPNNPDYLFNLAVSLDQLHQSKLAAQYYGQALTAADGHSTAFDRKLAEQRLHELQP